MKIQTHVMRAAAIAAACVVLSATGGCPSTEKSTERPTLGENLAPRLESVVDCGGDVPQKEVLSFPDLAGCTRIEVTYFPSTLRAMGFWGGGRLLDPNERLYLETLKTIVVDDPSRIAVLVQGLQAGSYVGCFGRPFMDRTADVTCYRGEERVISFEDYGFRIRTEDGHSFDYSSDPMRLEDVAPEIYPFAVRRHCASLLYRMGVQVVSRARPGQAWPAPDEWNDAVFQRFLARRGTPVPNDPQTLKYIAQQFVCPSARDGRCHYAMNPNCTSDSPADMVLLFETRPGWNQHGGPELFTFDNHLPTGGCVLLKGGDWAKREYPVVKFIRTEKELQALRWE